MSKSRRKRQRQKKLEERDRRELEEQEYKATFSHRRSPRGRPVSGAGFDEQGRSSVMIADKTADTAIRKIVGDYKGIENIFEGIDIKLFIESEVKKQ